MKNISLQGMLENPLFMGGTALLLQSLTNRREHNPLQDWLTGVQAASQFRRGYQSERDEQERQRLLGILTNPKASAQEKQQTLIRMYPQQYAQQQFAQPGDPRTNMIKNFEYLQQMQPGPQRQDFERILSKPSQQINILNRKPLSPDDLNKFQDAAGNPPPPGVTMQDIKEGGYKTTPLGAKKARQRMEIFETLNNTINTYVELINRYGTEIMPGEAKGHLRGAKNRLTMSLKEFDELGAPQAGDLMLLNEAIPDMTTVGAKLSPFIKNEALAQLEVLRQALVQSENVSRKAAGLPTIEVPELGATETPGTVDIPDDIYQRMKDLGVEGL